MPLTLSDTDQADAMVGVCDLLRGRIEQLAPLWSKGAPDVRDLLNGLLDTLARVRRRRWLMRRSCGAISGAWIMPSGGPRHERSYPWLQLVKSNLARQMADIRGIVAVRELGILPR